MALRGEVLRKYKEILRFSGAWRASEEAQTTAERGYIKEEARRLFRKNKHVGWGKYFSFFQVFPPFLVFSV